MSCVDYGKMQNIKYCATDTPTGGLQEIYYGLHNELEDLLNPATPSATPIEVALAKLRKCSFNKKDETTNFNEVLTNQTNGSQTIVPTVVTQFNGISKATRDAVEAISKPAVRLVLICKDASGAYWCMGRRYGMIASSVSNNTGTAASDFNGYSVTFTGEEDDMMIEVTVK